MRKTRRGIGQRVINPRQQGARAGVALLLCCAFGVLAGCSTSSDSSAGAADFGKVTAVASPLCTASSSATADDQHGVIPDPESTRGPVGAVVGTGVINLEHRDGYKARMTVVWHEPTRVDRKQLFTQCRALAGRDLGSDTGNDVITVVTAEVNMEFPKVDGFDWPGQLPVTVRGGAYAGDIQSLLANDTALCGTIGRAGLHGHWEINGQPPGGRMTLMWSEASKKTPKNPTGAKKFNRERYRVSASNVFARASCTGYGAENGDRGKCAIFLEQQ